MKAKKITNRIETLKMGRAINDIKAGDMLYLCEDHTLIGVAARNIIEGQAIYFSKNENTSDVFAIGNVFEMHL